MTYNALLSNIVQSQTIILNFGNDVATSQNCAFGRCKKQSNGVADDPSSNVLISGTKISGSNPCNKISTKDIEISRESLDNKTFG